MSVGVLLGVGATKAGTSWLYRSLADHPGCALRAVKELHYWDTFAAPDRARQVAALRAQLAGFLEGRDRAEAEGAGWQVANMGRRIADIEGLLEVLEDDRTGDAGYLGYLGAGVEGRLAADITPGYAVLPDDLLARMARSLPLARVLYLVRDPLARLWSHVRMQAERQRRPLEAVEEKANNTLWRILHRGQETHVTQRGDYAATVERLRRTVPEARLRIEYSERMLTPEGWASMLDWLGLAQRPVDPAPAHEGPPARLRDDLRAQATRMLSDHYEWAGRAVGPLPPEWRAAMEMA